MGIEDAPSGTLHRVARAAGIGALLAVALAASSAAAPGDPEKDVNEIARGVLEPPATLRYTDDLEGLLERNTLRVLVVPNQTHYFVDRGIQRGLNYDTFTLFGETIQRRYRAKRGARRTPFHVVFVPVPRNAIFTALEEGRGDVAAANLTVTEARQKRVDFTRPMYARVDEIIVSGPGAPPLRSLEDLAGQTVHVRPATSYFESLQALNQRFAAEGRTPMRLALLPDELENEDKLEMLNAGLIQLAVIERHLFEFWKQIFPEIRGHPELVVRSGGSIAWAVRKTNPKLRAALDSFVAKEYRAGSKNRNVILARYLKSVQWARPVRGPEELARYAQTVDLFRAYAAKYRFDTLLLLAQGFQESRLDQSMVSPVGALGLMQLMPATGREMNVGDIRQPEPNVHAGAAYLRKLVDTYFSEPGISDLNRMLFAFAAYNAGPNRISRLRSEATRLGYDRNVWFGNVELVVADRVGREPVQYVGNILKYYVAYTLVTEEGEARAAARKRLMPTGRPVGP